MSRSLLKPLHLTRKFRGGHYALCKSLSAHDYTTKLCLRSIFRKYGVVNNRLINAYARGCRLVGRVREINKVLWPRRNDPILRLTQVSLVYQNFAYGLRKRKKSKARARLKKFFTVRKYSMLIKFGEFLRTRFFRGFRLRKDVKKIAKMRKDIAKAKKRAQHQRRENSRLMRKAIMETRAARRRKLGPKIKKQATR